MKLFTGTGSDPLSFGEGWGEVFVPRQQLFSTIKKHKHA